MIFNKSIQIRTYISFFLLLSIPTFSQNVSQKTEAKRIENSPKIDGILDEEIWTNVPTADHFMQYEPLNGKPSQFVSNVWVTYDNKALYIAAYLYDTLKTGIYTQFGERDNDNLNADYFSVYLNPFCDGQYAWMFSVAASGIQVDARISGETTDKQWDAVWKSATKIHSNGWTVEISIPWSAIRFPSNNKQDWDINFQRNQRSTREKSFWNPVNNTTKEISNQMGKLMGITDIKVPLRLSLMPYISFYLNHYPHHNPNINNASFSYNAGVDLKYGITESFTLDMTLIPDFGQVASDEVILNLTPFEIKYNENRQFFTESTELFSRGDLFYSRRIGSTPKNYYTVNKKIDSTQTITENPSQTQMINATKISGRTKKGTGIGFLNAITSNTYATIENADQTENKILTQPLTNYNIIVYDQPFLKNSYISFVNTNVYYNKHGYMANVSGTDFKIADKRNKWALMGLAAVSLKFDSTNKTTDPGHKYAFLLGKISGNFKFNISNSLYSNTFNPNDFGYINNNNNLINKATISYSIYKPFWKLLNWHNNLSFSQTYLYVPRIKTITGFNITSGGTFKNYFSLFLSLYLQPTKQYDYYEPRQKGWFLIRNPYFSFDPWISTDYRKKLAFDVKMGLLKSKGIFKDATYLSFSPRIRVNDKLLIIPESRYDKEWRDVGYVSADSLIYMGQRNNRKFINTLNLSYSFNKDIGVSIKARHYWMNVVYNRFFLLQNNGDITEKIMENKYNKNFNAFNIDFTFKWYFAPGSNLSFVWKNAIISNDNFIKLNYYENVSNILKSDQLNSFSIKLLYYLDYMYLQKK